MSAETAESLKGNISDAIDNLDDTIRWQWNDPRGVLLNAAYCLGIHGRDADRHVKKILDRAHAAEVLMVKARDELVAARQLVNKMIDHGQG